MNIQPWRPRVEPLEPVKKVGNLLAMLSIPGFDEDQPIPTDPVEGVDLLSYAAVSAELVEDPAARVHVLGLHGLTERQWLRVEQTWLLRVAAAALRRDLSLANAYDEAFTRTQATLGLTDPTHSLEQYAQLVARLGRGQTAGAVLADAQMTLPAWSRLHRVWSSRLAQDEQLHQNFQDMVRTAE